MQIIDKTYFQKANLLNIPLSQAVPTANASISTPNDTLYLDNICERVEKSILLNAFQLAMYNDLQLALADINNPLYASYKKLVEGEEYDGKVWAGLNDDYSFIACKVYEEYLTETNSRLSSNGAIMTKKEGADNYTPSYKIAEASQLFYIGYQSGYLFDPVIQNNFIDWYGCSDDINVSLYQYMMDKKEDFPLFDIQKFRVYDQLSEKNSFGL